MSTTTLPMPGTAVRVSTRQLSATQKAFIFAGLIAAHLVLALVMKDYPIIGTGHALGCAAAGVLYAATTKQLRNVAVVIAYFVGCEVLWRMTKVSPFWEFGKLASLAVLLVALVRMRVRRNRALPLAYFGLLLPSAALTVLSISLGEAREHLSFNLSGPLLITVAALYFSNIRLEMDQLRVVFLALVIPTAGIALRCYLLAARTRLEFFNASNDYASGGFGANQVSAVLGLATMFLLLLSFERRTRWRIRIPLLIMSVIFGTQAVLTFSRGGVVIALAATAAALFFTLRGNSRARASIILVSMSLSLLGKFVIEPRLNELTEGKLSARYSTAESTGRDAFASSELAMFTENPVLGVGPGMGYYYREQHELRSGASHTEYTRMIGEHGLFGVLSLVCLVLLGAQAVRGARESSARALAAAMVVWTALFLAVYGTRIAAPALVLGLAFAVRTVIPAKQRA